MKTAAILDDIAAARPNTPTIEHLNEEELETILRRVLSAPATSESPTIDTSHSRRWIALSGATAVAVAGVAVGLQLSSSSAPSLGTAAGATVKAHLLGALDANDDIIEMKTTWSDGSYLDDWSNAAGTINHLIQTGWPQTLTAVTSTGTTFVAMYPETKTWLSNLNSSVEPLGNMNAIDDLRSRVQSETLEVLATNVEIDGQETTEVLLADPPLPASADSDLWVNASTDLPVQETAADGSTNGETTWSYFAPGSSAESNLSMPIPSDYTEVPPPAGSIIPPGGTLPIKIWNGTTQVSGGATCPSDRSCLIYPRTLPLPSSSTGSSASSGPVGNSGAADISAGNSGSA